MATGAESGAQGFHAAGEPALAPLVTSAQGRGVFVNYRRSDTRHVAARIGEKLATRLGESRVFLDVQSIRPGRDFRVAVQAAIQHSAVMLVLIGPDWIVAAQPDGRRRLDDPDDHVRTEIEEGLQHDVVVIPVLIDGTPMPAENALPGALAPLAACHAMRVDHHHFRRDDAALIDIVAGLLAVETPPESVAQPPDRLPGPPGTVVNHQVTIVGEHGAANVVQGGNQHFHGPARERR
jgi:hypothetical protein